MVLTSAILPLDEISLNYVWDAENFTIDSPVLEAKCVLELIAHEESPTPSLQAWNRARPQDHVK